MRTEEEDGSSGSDTPACRGRRAFPAPEGAAGREAPFAEEEAAPDGSRGGGAPARGRRRRARRAGSGERAGEEQERERVPRDPEEAARALCLRLLTGTPRTRRQLADAMRRAGTPDEVAERILTRFEDVGLIDDGAFANAWVESRHHGRGLARRALARELRTRGIADTLVDEAVAQLDHDQEEATARELVERKLRATRGLDRDRRIRRLASMLARKGYSEGLALRVVRQALEQEGDDLEILEQYLPE